MFCRFKMYMQLCTRHVDNTGHTFITIFLLQLFSCKLPWLVFLDSSQCQLLPYQQFHCSCSLWCLMSTARNVFSPHSIITLSRYIWSFKIFLYYSYKMIPQKAKKSITLCWFIYCTPDLTAIDVSQRLYHKY